MFKLLRESFKNTVYVRIHPEWLSVLHVESGKEYADIPVVAIETVKDVRMIVACGREALAKSNDPNITIKNGFEHPRTLIADFVIAERILKYVLLKQLFPKSLIRPSPIMIIHPLSMLEGGLTQVEIRAFSELGAGAWARKVYVWEGPELSREELRELRFSRAGGKLLHPEGS